MKQILKAKGLPCLTVILGAMAMVLRWVLYTFAVDEKNLLPAGHPLDIALTLFVLAVLAFLAVAVWSLDGSRAYEDNFSPSRSGALGHWASALGILAVVLLNAPRMYNYLGSVWRVLGLVSPACLVLAGIDRMRGKTPVFLLHLVPSMFYVFHIVNHYQSWSGDPQFQDYAFTLFGTITLMFFTFYHACFDVGTGNRRMQLWMGLASVVLCMAELVTTPYPYLYIGGIAFVLTNLCRLIPVPKPLEPEAPEKEA